MAFDISSGKKSFDIYQKSEIVLASLIIFLGVCFTIFMPHMIAQGGMIQAQDFIRLSPVFFPRMSFGALCILGLVYFLQTYRSERRENLEKIISSQSIKNVCVIFLFVAAYTFFLPSLGYGVATALMIFFLSYRLGNRIWWQLLILSLSIPLIIRIIFERILFIYLPRSRFEVIASFEDIIVNFIMSLFVMN